MERRWFICDVVGIFCVFLTYTLIGYALVTYTFFLDFELIIIPLWLCVPILYIVTSLSIWSHTKCMLTDPGALPKNASECYSEYPNDQNGDTKICRRCFALKIPKSHHCRVCKRCIRKMDHHCPWVNNCVGEFNQKYFILFCIYIFIMSLQCIATLAPVLSYFFKNNVKTVKAEYLALSLILFVEALIFLSFTFILCSVQIHNIFTNKSTIDRLKLDIGDSSSTFYERLTEAFGERFSYRWFLPITPKNFNQTNAWTV